MADGAGSASAVTAGSEWTMKAFVAQKQFREDCDGDNRRHQAAGELPGPRPATRYEPLASDGYTLSLGQLLTHVTNGGRRRFEFFALRNSYSITSSARAYTVAGMLRFRTA
jgi:hypothetical protein